MLPSQVLYATLGAPAVNRSILCTVTTFTVPLNFLTVTFMYSHSYSIWICVPILPYPMYYFIRNKYILFASHCIKKKLVHVRHMIYTSLFLY